MIIDTHVHPAFPAADSAAGVLKLGRERFERMMEVAGAAGIDRLCITGANPTQVRTAAQREVGVNGLLLELLGEHQKRLYGYAVIDPNRPREAVREMERCMERERVIGVKVYGSGPAARKANAGVYGPIMERLIDRGGIMLMHAWNKTTGNYEQESTPFEVAEMAGRFPKARIHMAHLGGAGYDGILAIAPHVNVFVDVSGGYPEAGFLEWAVGVLGPHRIVFGSDVPGRDFVVQLAKVTGADLDGETRAAILGGNMLRILEGGGGGRG